MKKLNTILLALFIAFTMAATTFADGIQFMQSRPSKAFNDDRYATDYYGVMWDESADVYARTGKFVGLDVSESTISDLIFPIHAGIKRCLLNDAGVVQYYLCSTDSTKQADCSTASDLTGASGQVMVEIPAFYYRYSYSGTVHTWEISLTKLNGFTLHPAFTKNGAEVDSRYIGAYEGSMYDDSLSQMVPAADIIENMYAAGDLLCSISDTDGYPKVNETRAEFRAMAANRGTGWRQLDYDLASAVQLLYLIEYADWYSQSMIGAGRTELSGGSWVADSYIGKCGKSNSDGNETNSVGGNTNDAYMTYRGIENFFGNVWKWVDGINVNANVPYVSNTDTNFADDTMTNYTDLGITLANANGYQITLEQQSRGFLPASIGGSSSTYLTDYYYQSTSWRVALLGGHAANGAYAGVACWHLDHASSVDYVSIGGRLCF